MALLVFTGAALAQSVVTTVTVGNRPTGIGVNVRTNQIYVANSGDNTVSVIDGASNAVTATVPNITLGESVAVNPSQNRIYADEFETSDIAVISGATQQVNQVPITTKPDPTSSQTVAVNPRTNQAYVCSNDQIVVLDGNSNNIVIAIPVPMCDFALAVDPVRNLIYAGTIDKRLFVINGATNTVLTTFGLDFRFSPPNSIAVDTLNNRLAITCPSSSGQVEIRDAASGQVLRKINGISTPEMTAFTPDGKLLLVTEGGANNLHFINAHTGTDVLTLTVGQQPIGVAINPATGMAYVANFSDGTVSVVSLH
jgi:YVTN family beta-propeller protein